MRFRWLIVAALCVATPALGFWQSRDSNYNLTTGSAPSYTGPGDLGFGAVTAFWGFRCYTAAYSGSVADITDSATGNTTGTRLKCDGAGNVVATVSASACTFVTGNACSALATTCLVACNVEKLYDQSLGNNCTSATCDVSAATNANRPTYLNNSATCGANSRSCMQFPGTNGPQLTPATSLTSVSQIYYWSTVFNVTANVAATQTIMNITSTIVHTATANKVQITAGSSAAAQTVNDNAWHTVQTTFNASSSIMVIDGASVGSLVAGSGAISGALHIGATSAATSPMTGLIAEIGIWPSTSTFNSTTLYNNQHAYYGF